MVLLLHWLSKSVEWEGRRWGADGWRSTYKGKGASHWYMYVIAELIAINRGFSFFQLASHLVHSHISSMFAHMLVQIASLPWTNWIEKCVSPNGLIEKTEEGSLGKALSEIAYRPWSLPLYKRSCLSCPPQTKICEIQSGTWILLSLHIVHLASQPSGGPDWCLPT